MDFLNAFFVPLLQGSGGFQVLILVCSIAVVGAVLRERSGWFFFSVLRMFGKVFSVPVKWLRGQMLEVAKIGDGTAVLADRDRTSLVRVALFGLRVFVAFLLTTGAGLGMATTMRACTPSNYARERVVALEERLENAKKSLAEQTAERTAFQTAHPDLEVDDPRLAPAVAAKAAADAAVASVEAKYRTTVQTANSENVNLGFLLRSLTTVLDRFEPDNTQHLARAEKFINERLCVNEDRLDDCVVLRGVYRAWTAVGTAQVAGRAAEAEVRRLKVEQKELRGKLKEIDASIESLGESLQSLKQDLDSAEDDAGIRFADGFKVFLESALSLLLLIWLVGVFFELVMLGFRWMDDIAALRERFDDPPSVAGVVSPTATPPIFRDAGVISAVPSPAFAPSPAGTSESASAT